MDDSSARELDVAAGAAAAAPVEIELKLLAAAADLRRVLAHPAIAASAMYAPVRRRLRSVYYDTPDLRLLEKAVALRLRRDGRRWLQTVKCGASGAGGLHQRSEWENSTSASKLDFAAVSDASLRLFLERVQSQRALVPVFSTDFWRTQNVLRYQGSEIELCIDRGEIRAGDAAEPISEMELELRHGVVADLFDLARELNGTLALRLSPASKAQRGYALFQRAQPVPVRAARVALDPAMVTGDALPTIVQACISQLQGNETGLIHGTDAEYTHQARVALRRLRTALSMFRGAMPSALGAELTGALRWLGVELSAARDWDVFALHSLHPVAELEPDHSGLQWLVRACAARRTVEQKRAATAILAPRYQALLLDLGSWLAARPWQAAGGEGPWMQPIGEFATRELERRHRRLRKRGKSIAQADALARHRLRLSVKKQRYATEFLSSLFARKRVQNYRQGLARVQEVLGAMNDAAVGLALTEEIALTATRPQHHQAVGIVRGWLRGRTQFLAEQLPEVWKEFLACKEFWR